jgi:putative DNA primase/helicase
MIIQSLMPAGSVISYPPRDWHELYTRSVLDGARLNVVPDLTKDALAADIKGIISGEGVIARPPGRQGFTFRPIAGHAFGCNRLPPTKDQSDGFWRRWLILPLNRSFQADPQRDPKIAEKIVAAERPQIVRWALDGAARLQRQSDYTLPVGHELTLRRWRGVEDSERLFIETSCRPCKPGERGELSSKLFDAYTSWAKGHGVGEGTTRQAFGQSLVRSGLAGKHSRDGERYAVRLLNGEGA